MREPEQKDDQWLPGFIDPASGRPIKNPVIINHNEIEPLIYDEETVKTAIEKRELTPFGITSENRREYVLSEQFTKAILEYVLKKGFRLSLNEDELRNFYACPVLFGFPEMALLCLVDGHTYDGSELLKVIFHGGNLYAGRSPINRGVINLKNGDLVIHPFHGLIKRAIEKAKEKNEKEIDLRKLFHNVKQNYVNRIYIQDNRWGINWIEFFKSRAIKIKGFIYCLLLMTAQFNYRNDFFMHFAPLKAGKYLPVDISMWIYGTLQYQSFPKYFSGQVKIKNPSMLPISLTVAEMSLAVFIVLSGLIMFGTRSSHAKFVSLYFYQHLISFRMLREKNMLIPNFRGLFHVGSKLKVILFSGIFLISMYKLYIETLSGAALFPIFKELPVDSRLFVDMNLKASIQKAASSDILFISNVIYPITRIPFIAITSLKATQQIVEFFSGNTTNMGNVYISINNNSVVRNRISSGSRFALLFLKVLAALYVGIGAYAYFEDLPYALVFGLVTLIESSFPEAIREYAQPRTRLAGNLYRLLPQPETHENENQNSVERVESAEVISPHLKSS